MPLDRLSFVERVAQDAQLPDVHGVSRFLRLVKHGPARAMSFVRTIGLGLVPETDDVVHDAQYVRDRIGRLFQNLNVQCSDSGTRVIAELARHCLNVGMPPERIVASAQGETRAEVIAVLKLAGAKFVHSQPSPSSSVAPLPVSQNVPTRPSTPLGPHMRRKRPTKP